MRRSLLYLGIVLFISSCAERELEEQIIRPVKVMELSSIEALAAKDFPGVSQEKSEAEIAFRVSGPLIKLNAQEGQLIKKGDLIAEIDPRDFKVDLSAKRARYVQTKAEMESYKALYQKGSVAKNDYDMKLANFLEAESAHDAAINALSDTKLYAPFTGFVGDKFVENFEEVKAKQTIITFIDLSVLEVKLFIPENLAVMYRQFESYEIAFEAYPDKLFSATIKEIQKSPEPEGFPLTLYLDHQNSQDNPYKIAPGMTCKIKINLEEETDSDEAQAILVPLTALIQGVTEGDSRVWVLNKEKMVVEARNVVVGGLSSNNSARIIDGLNGGETIVTAGARRLTEGEEVKILQERL